jgi:hypothetical protein
MSGRSRVLFGRVFKRLSYGDHASRSRSETSPSQAAVAASQNSRKSL